MKKEKKEEIKEELNFKNSYEDILSNMTTSIPLPEVEMIKSLKPLNKAVGSMDFMAIKSDCTAQALDLVDYLVDFYLNDELKQNPYIRKRMDDDVTTVADLLLQMKTSEHAIIKLLEIIDEGNVIARNFEVLAGLQKSKMEIVKHYEALKTNIENNYKGLKHDHDAKMQAENPIDEEEERFSTPGLGQKAMLNNLLSGMDLDSHLYETPSVLPPGIKLAKDLNMDDYEPFDYLIPEDES